MAKRTSETFHEYKVRVIDSKSKSFCGAKWLNASIWLGSGLTSSCHLPPAHAIDLDQLKTDPSALHNTLYKKQLRKMMQIGDFPSECNYCWKIEESGQEILSERVFKTQQFTDSELEEAFTSDPNQNSKLVSLEIGFDRTCQMTCSYCSAAFSSSWAQDIKINGAFQNLKSDGGNHFIHNGDHQSIHKTSENPYVQAFWKWWPELKKTLTSLRITGGEPLLSIDFWNFFGQIADDPEAQAIFFGVNSNLMVSDQLIQKFIDQSHQIKNLRVFTSAEAYQQHANYIRSGFNYEKWKQNIFKIADQTKIKSIYIMMTVNALCLFSICDFLDDVMTMKSKYSAELIKISINILRFPSFQSVVVLPVVMKNKFAQLLTEWCSLNFASVYLDEAEKESLLRLIKYLKEVQSPHPHSSAKPVLQSDFKNFYAQYDKRRGFKIRECFGNEFSSWYDSIVAGD